MRSILDVAFIQDKTSYILGSEKNAGKTTFLNYLLAMLRSRGIFPGYLSIGVDGEPQDLIFGNQKPSVYAEAGDFVITTENALQNTDCELKLLEVFPIKTVLGRICALQITRPGHLELIGPENNFQLKILVEYLENNCNCKTIIIDGALNRQTQLAATKNAGFFYICKITQTNLNANIDKVKQILFLLEKTKIASTENISNNNVFVVDGALTNAKLKFIPTEANTVVIEDITRVFLNYSELINLNFSLEIKNNYELHGIVINLFGVRKEDFLQKLNNSVLASKLTFNLFAEETI